MRKRGSFGLRQNYISKSLWDFFLGKTRRKRLRKFFCFANVGDFQSVQMFRATNFELPSSLFQSFNLHIHCIFTLSEFQKVTNIFHFFWHCWSSLLVGLPTK